MSSMITDIIDYETQHCDVTIIGFHNDADGWASAAQIIRFKKLCDDYSTNIKLFPLQHGPRNLKYEDMLMEHIRSCQSDAIEKSYRIILLDYCLQKDNMFELFSLADAGVDFTWIDHHEIEQSILNDLCDRRFMFANSVLEHHNVRLNKSKAACLQVADYIKDCAELLSVMDVLTIFAESPVLSAIAKRDIGDYEFCDDTDAVTSALFVNFQGYSFSAVTFESLSMYGYCLESNGDDLLKRGRYLCTERKQRFCRDVAQAFSLSFTSKDGDWFNCAAVFTTGDLVTPTATHLAKETGCAACAITVTSNVIILGFRSIPGSDLTAHACARMLGGGGHEHAAAASIQFNSLRQVGIKAYAINI